MRVVVLVLMFALALVFVIFGVQNTAPVNVNFIGLQSGYLSLSLVVTIAAIVGAALMGLLWLLDNIRRGFARYQKGREDSAIVKRNTELEKQVTALQQEIAGLRTAASPSPVAPAAPIADSRITNDPRI